MPAKISAAICQRAARIKLFLCDLDGVLTDGSIFIGGAQEIKRFNIRDGLGLVILMRNGIRVGWISNRFSPATELRAKELKIDFLQQPKGSKVAAIETIIAQAGVTWSQVSYMGDDVVDLGALKRAGVSIAPANATSEAKAAADYVTQAAAGDGAVREAVELILRAQNKWKRIVAEYAASN